MSSVIQNLLCLTIFTALALLDAGSGPGMTANGDGIFTKIYYPVIISIIKLINFLLSTFNFPLFPFYFIL
jgi:hypothetical protein